MTRPPFPLLALMLALPGSAHANPCPVDSLILCSVVTTATAPSYGITGCNLGTAGASYNLAAGHLSVGVGLTSQEAMVATEDIFTVVGPASPDPVPITATFTLQGYLSQYPSALYGQIRSGSTAQEVWIHTGPAVPLSIGLSPRVGESFHLALKLDVTAGRPGTFSQFASGTGDLSFSLPGAFGLISCQGYVTGAPTAARAGGWGRVRAIYR